MEMGRFCLMNSTAGKSDQLTRIDEWSFNDCRGTFGQGPSLRSLFEGRGLSDNDSVCLRAGVFFEIEAGGMRKWGLQVSVKTTPQFL